MEIIEKTLQEIGLTDAEAKIYIALLKLQEATAGEIAKHTNLQRSTVYFALDKLINSGLISHITKNNVKIFMAENPDYLRKLVDEKRQKVDKILGKLKAIEKQKKGIKVQVYEGYEGLKYLIKKRMDWLKKGHEVCIIASRESYGYEKYKILWQQHEKVRKKKGAIIKLISPEKDRKIAEKEFKEKGRYERFIDWDLPASFVVYGNVVSIIILGEEEIQIHIEDERIAKAYKHYFNLMWKQART